MEERTKNFINTVIFVSRIFSGLKDKFLARKLYDKLSDFVAAYSRPPGGNVAQYSSAVLTSINALAELLDYLEHSKMVSTTPLLYVRRSLFSFKLQSIRMPVRGNPPAGGAEKDRKEVAPPPPKIKKEMSGNKEKILSYIKRSPNSRTKEIIYEFNVLSERTVKRNLKELVDEGFVKRVSKDNAVYYNIK